MLKKRGPDPDWIAFSSTEARWINFNAQMRVQTLALAQIVICNELNLAKDFLTKQVPQDRIRFLFWLNRFFSHMPWQPVNLSACQPVRLVHQSDEAVFGRSRSCRCDEDMVNAWIDDAMSVLFHWISKQQLSWEGETAFVYLCFAIHVQCTTIYQVWWKPGEPLLILSLDSNLNGGCCILGDTV